MIVTKLKKVAATLITSIIILLVVALFTTKKYDVVRSIVINKPNAEVFNYIKYLENHNNFIIWTDLTKDTTWVYKGKDGEVGYTSFWKNNSGVKTEGEKEITRIDQDERFDFELRFLYPFDLVISSHMTTESLGANKTKVTWTTNKELPYPKNIILVFYDYGARLGNDVLKGLNNLKVILEDTDK